MNSFYLYSFKYKNPGGASSELTATVIFCSNEEIDERELQAEVRTFYQHHYQPDQIFVIGSHNMASKLIEVFQTNEETTFKGIPKRQELHLHENLFILAFDKNGQVKCKNGKEIPEGFEMKFRNEGMQQIFTCRGGLIVSESSHHYVFPSGKHCDRFLRTGNILLYSPEIYFIAFCLLKHFNEENYSRIYSDTSSINSVAYALFDLKSNLLNKRLKVSIESFSSYDGLYGNEESYTKDSFLIISASTSSNIVKYVLDNHKILERDNIAILYFHGKQTDFNNVKGQVICNLTKSESNPDGIDYYPTYLEKDCEHCRQGSYPVPVSGDVFLLEKPQVNRVMLSVNDREKNLSSFVEQFLAVKRGECVFKCHFKEDSQNEYEVYIDFAQVLNSLGRNKKMAKFSQKLDDYISQYVPADTTYLVHLNDSGSHDLGKYILQKISAIYSKEKLPQLISQDELSNISKEPSGSIVVTGSCISNGKNLLYISRALRKYDKLKIVYFIGVARSSSGKYLRNLAGSLKRGKYGPETNGFMPVQTIYCSSNSRKTPWMMEVEFLKEMELFINDNHPDLHGSLNFFQERRQFLEEGAGERSRGISDRLFYPRITDESSEELRLRKNFAFFDFDEYVDDVTQADVYFTINNVINSLRNSDRVSNQLKQAVYVRNLIDPNNFNRLNDGVIQASILRSASSDELSYAIDNESSQEMFNTLETMIKYYEQEQGEALLEFLYSLAIKKLSLARSHLVEILELIKKTCKHNIFKCFYRYLHENLLVKPERLRSEPFAPPKEIGD